MVDLFTVIGAGAGIIESIFGKKRPTLAEKMPGYMASWKSRMTPLEWNWFIAWIKERQQKNDWLEACPYRKDLAIGLRGDSNLFIVHMARTILHDSGAHCFSDAETKAFSVEREIAKAQAAQKQAGIIPGVPSIGGLSPLVVLGLVGIGLYLLLGRR